MTLRTSISTARAWLLLSRNLSSEMAHTSMIAVQLSDGNAKNDKDDKRTQCLQKR